MLGHVMPYRLVFIPASPAITLGWKLDAMLLCFTYVRRYTLHAYCCKLECHGVCTDHEQLLRSLMAITSSDRGSMCLLAAKCSPSLWLPAPFKSAYIPDGSHLAPHSRPQVRLSDLLISDTHACLTSLPDFANGKCEWEEASGIWAAV